MTIRWTTEDIARELHLGSRAAARKWIQRHRANGAMFPYVLDEKTGDKLYNDRMLWSNHWNATA